jgi:hypothetical protein
MPIRGDYKALFEAARKFTSTFQSNKQLSGSFVSIGRDENSIVEKKKSSQEKSGEVCGKLFTELWF